MVTKRFHFGDAPPLTRLVWHRPVAQGAYEWITASADTSFAPTAPAGERRFLCRSPGGQFENYEPLQEYPALFRLFADLTPTESGFGGFADRFGELGVGVPLDQDGPLTAGESLQRWVAEHSALNEVLNLQAAVSRRSAAAVGSLLNIERSRVFIESRTATRQRFKLIASTSKHPHLFAEGMARRGWARQQFFANLALQVLVNDRLVERGGLGAQIVTVLSRTRDGTLSLQQVPKTLLAALWFQCATAIAASYTYRQCESCRTWFWVSPEGAGKRRQARYCGSRCKVRAYRDRQRQALAKLKRKSRKVETA